MSIQYPRISLAVEASMEKIGAIRGYDMLKNKEKTPEEYAEDLIRDLNDRGFKIMEHKNEQDN